MSIFVKYMFPPRRTDYTMQNGTVHQMNKPQFLGNFRVLGSTKVNLIFKEKNFTRRKNIFVKNTEFCGTLSLFY